jgi:hypothetical protein
MSPTSEASVSNARFSRDECLTTSGSTAYDGRKAFHVVVLVVCASILAASWVLRAETENVSLLGFTWPFHCWLNETLGIRCALCGMSRSFCSLAHGDIAGSLTHHAVGPALFALLCLQVPYRIYALTIHPHQIGTVLVVTQRTLAAAIGATLLLHWLLYLGGLIP